MAPRTIEQAAFAVHEGPARHYTEVAASLAHQANMLSSAESCVNDARTALDAGKWERALFWAQRSLSYSVGKCSDVFCLANGAWQEAEEVASMLRSR